MLRTPREEEEEEYVQKISIFLSASYVHEDCNLSSEASTVGGNRL